MRAYCARLGMTECARCAAAVLALTLYDRIHVALVDTVDLSVDGTVYYRYTLYRRTHEVRVHVYSYSVLVRGTMIVPYSRYAGTAVVLWSLVLGSGLPRY